MFITYEGIEGSGKSTQMEMLADYMEERGATVVKTREPGGCQLGRRLRSMLLDCRQTELTPRAELCLFLADRCQHLAEIILPALEAGHTVLCDRYTDSTIAYQGFGRGMDVANLRALNQLAAGALMPDLTFLLDLPVQTGLSRAGARNRIEGTVISEGRFDSESLDFHKRVREGYLEIARGSPERVKVIDASRSAEEIFADCVPFLEKPVHA